MMTAYTVGVLVHHALDEVLHEVVYRSVNVDRLSGGLGAGRSKGAA